MRGPVEEGQWQLPLPFRGIMLLAGMAGLFGALWAGLWRLGWNLPVPETLPANHGPLMISGFLGTVISLERAVALRKIWPFAAPVFAALASVLMLTGTGGPVAAIAVTAASVILTLVFFRIFFRDGELHYAVMGVGANLWLAGNILWLRGFPMPVIALWWAGFLVLTVAGERLELSRILQPGPSVRRIFLLILGLLIGGMLAGLVRYSLGVRLVGGGFVALAVWLWQNDLARKSVGRDGISRFMALALILGYIWLGISGGIGLIYGGVISGPIYDAFMHALFVGFIFSMIFGHAPVIFPVVLGIPLSYRTSYYLHLGLLHLSLILRIAGDLIMSDPLRRWGGLLNAAAILVFIVNTVSSAIDAKTEEGP